MQGVSSGNVLTGQHGTPSLPAITWGRLFWVLALITAAVWTVVARGAPPLPGDIGLTLAVQSAGAHSPAGAVLQAVNWLNSGIPVILLVVAIGAVLALMRRWDLLSVFAAANMLRPISSLLKWLTGRARPTDAVVRILERPHDFSFPSGHTFGAVLCYGTLAILIGAVPLPSIARHSIQAACAALILLQGPARVYAGAHWPSDVLGAYLWGAVVLAALIHAARRGGLLAPPAE